MKSGVFTTYFSDPKNAAQLYTALEGIPAAPEDIEYTTLEGVLFLVSIFLLIFRAYDATMTLFYNIINANES